MTFEETRQKKIEEAIKKKEVRQSKTELSIGFRWAINVTIAFMPEDLRGTKKGFSFIEKWYPKFQELDREYMLDHISEPDRPKLTAKDFIEAKAEAPAKQTAQRVADEVSGEEKLAEEKERERNETEAEYEKSLPTIQQ